MLFSFLISLLLLNPLTNVYSQDKQFFNIVTDEVRESPERINPENIGVKISSDKYVALDVGSGKLLLEKNAREKSSIASITKLMTALTILDLNPNWQLSVELLKADETVGAQSHIYRGEEILFVDLWKAALISSDNNAIVAMVRALGYNRDDFVVLMNKKAEEIEMFDSVFADPTGLDENNISTPLDVSRLLYNALQKNEIKESVIQGRYSFKILNTRKNRNIYNTDILIDSFLNSSKYGYELVGGKTGFLPEAGYCLATEIKKDNHEVIIVALNSETINSRFQDVKVIADWVYANYEWK